MLHKKLVAALIVMAITGTWHVSNGQAGAALDAPAGVITIAGKKPVNFDHQIHLKLGVACGQCHHDAQHQPRTAAAIAALAKGALQCASCHNDQFAKAELRERKEIFHARCKGCHTAGFNGKNGPTSCAACHGKSKKGVEGC